MSSKTQVNEFNVSPRWRGLL